LAHEASSLSLSRSILPKTKAFDMCVGEGAVVAGIALDFADLNHLGVESGCEEEDLVVLGERAFCMIEEG
jgi:hypothetical protein